MLEENYKIQNPPQQLRQESSPLASVAIEPEADSNESSHYDPLDPPDGGRRAWLAVLGSSLALFSTTGVNNGFGVFQAYYKQNLLSNSSSSAISLIGAVQVALIYGGGPITGKIFDAHGLKVLLPLGSFLVVLSLMLVSVCQQGQLYQFFLAQGVLAGIGNAMIFTPTVAVMGHWFKRRRAYAIGIVVAGSSLGGVIYPIMLQRLLTKFGFSWTVRIAGFMTLGCLIIAMLTIKTRFPPTGAISLSNLVDIHGFRDIRYTLTAISSFLFFYVVLIPYFYIQEYAEFRNVAPRISPYLLAIINGCGIPARIIPGLLGDRFGILKVLLPSIVCSGIVVFALWLPSRGIVPMVFFSVLYGLFASGFTSLLPAYIATISPVEKLGARLGAIYFFLAISSIVGTPTGGAFVPSFTQEHFDHLIVFVGVLLLVSAALLALAHRISTQPQHASDVSEDETKDLPLPEKGPHNSGREEEATLSEIHSGVRARDGRV